ncbi:hypothetical protein C5N14_11710 [Micromonospora sp. MW-13]|uniref:hypothetical protein n=1 Tax=Micromonospora sp. MW-13 TaxID=2094022 RepID=UPI000E447E39|nr:hypothetical protein [Micromonospora sp. MW-13]RGC68654.1 hypothetical protein C5N14_11710 [Micromonospora sp. MW-13]
MTAGGFREVDHDLLADYLGGALDGTPDEAVVARLVEEDPAWAEAHDALAPALARVGEDLAAWAGPAPEMPLAVADRIAAALAGAGPGTPTGPSVAPDATDRTDPDRATGVPPALVPAQPSGGSRRPAGGSGPTTGRTGTAGPGRRGRRWVRIAGPVALATAAVFAVGLGLNRFVTESTQSDSAATTTMREPAGAAMGANGSFRATGNPQHSGIDWTPEALASGAPRTGPSKSVGQGSAAPEVGGGERLPAVGDLDRLTAAGALTSCLTAVSTEYGAGPLTVDLVDYARFRGDPALIVRFVDPSGVRWAWVSGPECGVPGSGADTRYRARVG